MSTNSLYYEVVIGGFATKRHGWKEDLMVDSIHTVKRDTTSLMTKKCKKQSCGPIRQCPPHSRPCIHAQLRSQQRGH